MWERKNAETASRITGSLEKLLKLNEPITLAGVQRAILAQSGVRLSLSTIQRSEAYRQHRRTMVCSRRSPTLDVVLNELGSQGRRGIVAKASRLRRENKEALIAKILLIERAVSRQAEVERALQQEVFRLQIALMSYPEGASATAKTPVESPLGPCTLLQSQP